ncbi:MAG TPA: 5'-3' exonuclease H3TH domain-containing protein [Candidatus Acidoferrum sp.]|nr:5'-3' exonuclease H3TH domain-containing protein [Candidatus Acidoferrum sp.]
MQAAPPRLLLVDGHAYAYRAFHAIQKLNGPDGAPTNAVYGFIKMLLKMESTLKPTHHCVVWDGGLSAKRMVALPEYKEHRPPMPSDLERQIPEIESFLDASNFPSFVNEGVEADDWIASQACCAVRSGVEVVIASADKDFLQLVSNDVGLLNPNDKSEVIWKHDQVRAKTGLEPEQVVDWLSLIGDSVDNIKGVPGIGPKTATDLLKQFGSIDAIYSRLGEVKSDRIRTNLQDSAAIVRRNQELIRLHTDLPCDFQLEKLAVRVPDAPRLQPLYERWGFKTLLAQLEAEQTSQGTLL